MCADCREATSRNPRGTLNKLCAGFLQAWSEMSSGTPACVIAVTPDGAVIDGELKDPIFIRKAAAKLVDLADEMDQTARESRANT